MNAQTKEQDTYKDRVAASNIGAEQSVIGAMIIDNKCIPKILGELSHDSFIGHAHRLLFKAITKLTAFGTPTDLITLSDEIEVQGHGELINISYIAELAKNTPSSANVMAYVEVVKKNSATRKIEEAHQDFMQGGITLSEYKMLTEQYADQSTVNKLFNLKANISQQDDFYNGPIEHKELIFHNCLPLGEVAMLTGAGGSGKSFSTIHLAVSVALGLSAFIGYNRPFKPTKAGKVVVLGGEDFRDDYKRRVRSVLTAMECNTQSMKNRLVENLHITSLVGDDIRIIAEDRGSAKLTGFVDNIAREVEELGDVRLVILDPMSAFYGAQENDNHSATMFVNAVNRICKATGAAVLMVHHSSKGSAGSARGASGFIDRSRTHISLKTVAQVKEQAKRKKDGPITVEDKNTVIVNLEKTNHVKFWEEPIYLKRSENGAFTATKPTNYESTIHERDQEYHRELDLIEYLKRDGSVVSKNEIETNRDTVFTDHISLHKCRELIKIMVNDGRLIASSSGVKLAVIGAN
ncbi:AAA family ATPase [Photobacterium profundum]|uniref:DNA helicase DnaB-like N-terminal domain-containing protein n=1 Tax=Photobacterium profundum (strain SS9) TaxID=298386 RepID=Q6LHC5_PHOPR|nr:AAA family ATPase [Photobacterium profundum]CAG23305.1 hypothetical protein PBPRB1439 [Photobacterium profundum SS9]